ncbi:MAG: hypothetical protein Q9188_001821 [Gyalolechia gomerana]
MANPNDPTGNRILYRTNLRDFRSTSCFSPFSYGVLYIFLLISVAVYAVDLFTAANLLFFNRWSGQVKPVISFNIAKWIFAACILLSLVLLVYRWIRALRVIKSGVVAASYLDPLAVRIQSIRPGARGQGWRRFLVFSALTESRKGAEYVALFTHFSFEAWMRIIFAQGPRQLLNAQTLYAVMKADLVPAGDHAAKDGHSAISQFWINTGILANHNREQAAILFGMLFTLLIWIISVVSLLVACIFYVTFLWHHIPSSDGSLTRYCRRKIDTRLSKIVSVKVNKALARGDNLRARGAARTPSGERPPQVKRQPTIPLVDDDDQSVRPGDLTRQTTQNTLSSTPSHHATAALTRQPTIPDVSPISERPDAPSRSTTQSSARTNESYGSDAPLMGAAGGMGYCPARSYSRPLPSRSASNQSMPYDRVPMSRKPTAGSQNTQKSYNPAFSWRPPPGRMDSNSIIRGPSRQNTELSTNASTQYGDYGPLSRNGTHTSIPSPQTYTQSQEYEMRPQPPSTSPSRGSSNSQYVAYNPNVHNGSANFQRPATTAPAQDYFSHQPYAPPPQRSGAAPLPPPPRSGTAPPPQASTYDNNMNFGFEGQRSENPLPPIPSRPATAGPGALNGQRRPFQRF